MIEFNTKEASKPDLDQTTVNALRFLQGQGICVEDLSRVLVSCYEEESPLEQMMREAVECELLGGLHQNPAGHQRTGAISAMEPRPQYMDIQRSDRSIAEAREFASSVATTRNIFNGNYLIGM